MQLAAFPADLIAAARKQAGDVLGELAGAQRDRRQGARFLRGVPRAHRAVVAHLDQGGAGGEGGVNIHPLIPAKAGIQGHLLRLKELGSRWSLYSGRPKAGPEHGNERRFYLRLTECSR